MRAPTGASLSKPSSADSEAANWKRWGQRVSAQLWEAVALSIDIEPESLPIDWRPADYSDPFEECPCEFKRRIDIAIDHAKNGQLPLVSLAFTDPPFSRVRLQDISDWAGSLGWSLPHQFPRRPMSDGVSLAAGAESKVAPPTSKGRSRKKRDAVKTRIAEKWPNGLPEGIAVKQVLRELKFPDSMTSTVRRALGRKK